MTTQPSRSPLAALVWGVAIPATLWVCYFAGLILVVPRYKKIFAEFNLRLPDLTIAVIAVTDWAVTYWYVLVLSLPFLLAPDVAVVLLLWRSGRRGLVWVWGGVMIALPLVAGLLVVVAIHLALTNLLEGLSK
jgi:type II secretory pathway component PulF